MAHPPAHTADPQPRVPAELYELVLELALAVQKRAIYPATHPMLRGAVESLAATMNRVAADRGTTSITIANDRLLVEGVPVDSSNAVLRDFAAHLHEHQLAGIRVMPGVDAAELDDFVMTIATSAKRVDKPLGTLGDEALFRWRHIGLYAVTFDGLMLDDDGTAVDVTPDGAAGAEALWKELARVAMDGEVLGEDPEADPEAIAEAISRRGTSPEFDQVVLETVARLAGECVGQRSVHALLARRRLSELIRSLSPDARARLLELRGDTELRNRFLQQSVDLLSASAVVDLVTSAAAASGNVLSRSLMRMLSKLARNADADPRHAELADATLRDQLRRMLRRVTLEDPNPDSYDSFLTRTSARGGESDVVDRGLDQVEPERTVEISLDSNQAGEATHVALGRMVVRLGLTEVLDRLSAYPETTLRDQLIDGLVNDIPLGELLAAESPDVRLLRYAVSHVRLNALPPLLAAVEARDEADAPWLRDLIVAIGDDAVPALIEEFPKRSPKAQLVLLGAFDRLDAIPDPADLHALGRHANPALRREALRLMMKSDVLRVEGIVTGLRDADDRIVAMAIAASITTPSPRVATALIWRLNSETFVSPEMRARAIRGLAASGSDDGVRWIASWLVTRHWLFRWPRLRRRSIETIAGIQGLAAYWSGHPAAAKALEMARASRDAEVARAATARAVSA